MARNITAGAKAYALNTEIQLTFLVELKLDSGTQYYTTDNKNHTYNGNTYLAAPAVQVSSVNRDMDNNVPSCSLQIGNVNLTGTNLIANEIRGIKVVIYKYGDEQYVYPYFSGRIESYNINEMWLTLNLQGNLSVMQVNVPFRTFSNKCPWVFKSTECGYAGSLNKCSKSYSDCQIRNRLSSFGGFGGDS